MLDLLVSLGPWVVLVLTFMETVFVTGLVIPAGPAILVATTLAVEGHYPLAWVVGAALLGGGMGDSGGFVVGRRVGRRVLEGEGFFVRAARGHLPRAASLAARHPIVGVSFARLVSFVRTLSPQLAGMSHITYPRFLAYDLLGLVGWAVLYVGVGLLVGEGWREASRLLGTLGALVLALALLAAWIVDRRRRIMSANPPPPEGGGS